MATTDTSVTNLIINKLSRAQFDSIQTPSETELYLVPDEIDTTPTSGSVNPVTSHGVYTAINAIQQSLAKPDWSVSDPTDSAYIINTHIVTDELTYLHTAYDTFKAEYDDDNLVISYALTDLNSRVEELNDNAFSGDYDDLTNKPTIPTLVQANWNQTIATALDYIKNKPDKYDIMDDLNSILVNESDTIYFGDLHNASIEIKNTDGTPQDANYEIRLQINDGDSAIRIDTSSGLHIYDYTNDHLQFNDLDIAFKNEIVQSNWNETNPSSYAYILNKPNITGLPTVTAADNGKILMVVDGEWALVSPSVLYQGTGIPNNSQGNNGDLYTQTS